MKGYVLKINNKLKGVYTSIEDILDFLDEVFCLISNPFNLEDFCILIYKLNSPILENELKFRKDGLYSNEKKYYLKKYEYKIFKNLINHFENKNKSPNIITKKNNKPVIEVDRNILSKKRKIEPKKVIKKELTEEEKKKEEELLKKKKELNHQKNLLVKEKEKIEESKNVYKVDLRLYLKFKKEKVRNEKFIIPELFRGKYLIFKDLEENEKLSWNNFNSTYNNVEKSSYNSLFKCNDPFMNKIENENIKKYDLDLKIYNKLKLILEKTKNFKIPIDFEEKYKIFQKLYLEDDISYKSFTELYNYQNNLDDSSYDSDSEISDSVE